MCLDHSDSVHQLSLYCLLLHCFLYIYIDNLMQPIDNVYLLGLCGLLFLCQTDKWNLAIEKKEKMCVMES